ncbi:uncharacterized protein DEA37_0007374 [Paragonimus westermani]|uniref:Uncharacterized protein n=1 Tax=Paragonimus westermani TaxID=34504 RepID=A0A5J4NBD4_9TREM|nr:uncharacterized protein DEA37_0007374 [Paragonimus westermani]
MCLVYAVDIPRFYGIFTQLLRCFPFFFTHLLFTLGVSSNHSATISDLYVAVLCTIRSPPKCRKLLHGGCVCLFVCFLSLARLLSIVNQIYRITHSIGLLSLACNVDAFH